MKIHPLLILILSLSACQTISNNTERANPIKAEDSYKLGLDQARNHDYQAAISSFESAIRIDKNYVKAYMALGGSYFFVLKFKDARTQWDKAVALDPKSKEAYIGIGYLDFMDNKYDSAIKSFETAISADPNFSTAHTAQSVAYMKSKV